MRKKKKRVFGAEISPALLVVLGDSFFVKRNLHTEIENESTAALHLHTNFSLLLHFHEIEIF